MIRTGGRVGFLLENDMVLENEHTSERRSRRSCSSLLPGEHVCRIRHVTKSAAFKAFQYLCRHLAL
jgi:hypothetical protein